MLANDADPHQFTQGRNMSHSHFARDNSHLFYAIGFIFMTVVLGWLGYENYRQGTVSQKWPTVPGIVVKVTDRSASDRSAIGHEIEYEYSVEGRNFTSNRISTQWFPPASGAWAQKGESVQVSYNPDNPEFAVILPGIDYFQIGLMGLLGCVGLIGAFVYLGIYLWPESESDKSLQVSSTDDTFGEGFLGSFRRGLRLSIDSLRLLSLDPELIAFPILSGLGCVVTLAGLFYVIFSTRLGNRLLHTSSSADVMWIGIFAAFYMAISLVITFFNAGLTACVIKRLNGGNPSVLYGIRVAVLRFPQIIAWSMVDATFGRLVSAFESHNRYLQEFVASLLRFAWSVTTFFVVPVMVVERANPISAVTRSCRIMGDTWGESLGATCGTGMITLVAYLLATIPLWLCVYLGSGTAVLVGMVFTIVLVLLVMIMSSATQSILRSALYLYASTDATPAIYDEEFYANAFQPISGEDD